MGRGGVENHLFIFEAEISSIDASVNTERTGTSHFKTRVVVDDVNATRNDAHPPRYICLERPTERRGEIESHVEMEGVNGTWHGALVSDTLLFSLEVRRVTFYSNS